MLVISHLENGDGDGSTLLLLVMEICCELGKGK